MITRPKRVLPLVAASIAAVCCLLWRNDSHGSRPFSCGQSTAYAHCPRRPRANGVSKEDKDRMIDNRLAGLRQDRTRIPATIAALNPPAKAETHMTNLLALARLGAVEALPAIDALIAADADQETTSYAIAARARLVAEADAREQNVGADRASAKVQRFYEQLRLSPDDLNGAEAAFQPSLQQPGGGGRAVVVTPVGVNAVQELADMVYHGSYKDYALLPGVTGVNFQVDHGAGLKMRLAPLSRQQRITTMVEELSHKKKYALWDALEGQLLADEGSAASQAMAAKLRDIREHRSGYSAEGIGSMFGILGDIGDPAYAPLVESFREDSDPAVAEYAERTYGAIAKGIRVQAVYGY